MLPTSGGAPPDEGGPVNEPTITFSGNLAAKPTYKTVAGDDGGSAVANMRVAVTPRVRPRGSTEWVDGETVWFRVSAWRRLALHCFASLNQGDRVVVKGRLTQRTWTDENGVEHAGLQVEAEEIGLDLSRHTAVVMRDRPPVQRQGDEVPEGVDAQTGEIVGGSAELDDVDELEPAGV